MSPANSDSFTSFFPIWIHVVSFAFMTAVSRNSSNILKESGNRAHLWRTPDFRGKVFCFSALNMMSVVDCHIWPLLGWGMFPLKPICCKVFCFCYCFLFFCFLFFTIKGSWILSKFFSESIEVIIWFLFFSFFNCTLIDLQILNNPCIPRINPTWSWCLILLTYCWIWFPNIVLRIFASLCSSVILACNFLLLSGFGIRVTLAHRINLEVTVPLQIFGVVWEEQNVFLLLNGRIYFWSHLVLNFCKCNVM